MSLKLNYWQHLVDMRSKGRALNVFYDENSTYSIIVVTTTGEIFRYSTSQKKWIQYHYHYHDSYHFASLFKEPNLVHTLINDRKDAILFLFIAKVISNNLCIAELKLNEDDLNKREMKIIYESNDRNWYPLDGSCPIIMQDRIHLIGGHINKKHSSWNRHKQKFDTLHFVYNERIKINYAQLVKVGNFVLSFGGSEKASWQSLDDIHQYDIINNKWKRLKITMPKPLSHHACAAIMNGKYVLLFGGICRAESYDDIYLYSVQDKMFRLLNVKYPQRGQCYVVSVHDRLKEELSVYGFVRYQWRTLPLHQQLFPPRYIIHIMRKYYHIEYIHLFHKNGHWTIDIFDLI